MTALLALAMAAGWGQPEPLFSLNDDRLNESSGIGASPTQSGVLYCHNDSGDEARFFRIERPGVIKATYRLKGAQAVDWEDMAVTRIAGRSWVYLADVGDNSENRPFVNIYRVAEPERPRSQELTDVVTYRLQYPDKAHNCEAFFVDPRGGDFYIVTKDAKGSEVFYLRAPARGGNYTLTKLGDLKIATGGLGGNLVTGADVSPDGKSVVVRTYSGAREYSGFERLRDWFKAEYVSVPIAAELQGEAICYTRDGNGVITNSEKVPTPFTLTPRSR